MIERKREFRLLARASRPLAVSALALAIAACGGGGGVKETPPPPVSPPPSTVPPPETPLPETPLPLVPSGTYLTVIRADRAVAAGHTGAGVKTGVIDSGIDREHPALVGKVLANDVLVGEENDLDVDDANGHGTLAAQLIAGSPLGDGPGGVAPEATLVSVRLVPDVLQDGGPTSVHDIFGEDAAGLSAALDVLTDNDVHLLNLPWSGDFHWAASSIEPVIGAFDRFLLDRFPTDELDTRLLVVAAGDGGHALTAASADLAALPLMSDSIKDGWLAVAAVQAAHPDKLASYSNACGDAMRFCMAAPGDISFTTAVDDAIGVVALRINKPNEDYVLQARQTIMHADGGITGQFWQVFFLDGPLYSFSNSTLSYDANNIYLDIVRTDIAAAAALLGGITPAALVSAQRIEATFDGIDAGDGASPAFLAGAGRIQSSASEAIAKSSLQSLSGEMHARADEATFDNIDASRRAVSMSFSARSAAPALHGGWSAQLDGIGNGNFSSNGWMTGTAVGVDANRVVGFAFGESNSTGYQTTGRDRAQERQSQAQIYLGQRYGKAYALGQLGAGQYQRQLRRDVQLGEDHELVATEYADDFFTANLETGYGFGRFTPYASVDYMRLARGGFSETGGSGFGLKASAGSAEWVRAIAGLRAERRWGRLGMHGFAEWQQSLVEDGLYAKASFAGANAWAPLYGEGLYASGGLFGIGGDATLSKHASLTFGYDQRFGARNNERQWTTRLRYGF